MSIFQHSDYRAFLRDHLRSLPKEGRGEIGRIARSMGIHPSLLSLVISGSRDLSQEQAYDLAGHLELTEMEADFLSLLVAYSRAGSHRYKTHLKKRLEGLRKESQKVSRRFEHERSLSEVERSIFYSSWLYSAVRLFASTGKGGRTVEEVAAQFGQPRQKMVDILNFLAGCGLLLREKERFLLGAPRTFLEYGSPHLVRHHTNWRNKAIQRADSLSEEELMFTSPISLSREDFAKIREEVAGLLKSVSAKVKDSPAEEVACLNIDLFWVGR